MTIPEVSMLATGWALGIQTMLIVQAVQMRLDDRRDARRLDEARARINRTEAADALERANAAKAATAAMQRGIERLRQDQPRGDA